MARGGYRPGAGRPKGSTSKPKAAGSAKPAAKRKTKAAPDDKAPLDYMLGVMNDPDADDARRDRMAIAAAPFVHARAGEEKSGKRAQAKDRAAAAAEGRFASPPPPKLVVNNR